ncbi:hypothetical protein BDR04DRAFT_1160056 [Suillus decipiens]|nr:hypothetical protein BDR04DRAFT_1160056 [Suillus decipiens]
MCVPIVVGILVCRKVSGGLEEISISGPSSSSLNNLANSLEDRFQRWGVPCDPAEVMELIVVFKQRGLPPDLDATIELLQAALLSHFPDHSLRSRSLKNPAINLHDRFEQRGVPCDLDEVIAHPHAP